MRSRLKTAILAALVILAAGLLSSCAALEPFLSALSNLQRLQFRLADVSDFSVLGIRIEGKSALNDFSVVDEARPGIHGQNACREFVLRVEVRNPNDGTGRIAPDRLHADRLESRLLIDGTPTVIGNIDQAIEIPGQAETPSSPSG